MIYEEIYLKNLLNHADEKKGVHTMSMKLKAFLMENIQSKMEQAYLQSAEVLTLKNVPCEMEFEAISGWMEHESEKHQYLPVFHLTGRIKEVHGNFPYNVSSLTFSEMDMNQKLQKDILYYMKPDELAHLIQTGQFYTKNFQVPEILSANTYSFPVLVDMTVVPPPKPLAYEQALYDVGLSESTVEGIDKTNLPIFYLGFAGTGVNRKKDALLDYYGIEFDEDFPLYVLTAESSGYTDPPLMQYITEPVLEQEEELQSQEDLYVTPEEEALLQRQQEEKQAEAAVFNPQDDYQMTAEDILLAQADRNIESRMAEKLAAREREALMEKGIQPPQAQAEQQKQSGVEKQHVTEKVQENQKVVAPVKKESALERLTRAMAQVQEKPKQTEKPVMVKEETVEVQTYEEPTVQPEIAEEKVTVVDTKETEQGVVKESNPENPESYKAVEAVVKNESDAQKRMDELNGQKEDTELGVLEEDETDRDSLEDANGADVSDARLQAKIEEAKARENARAAAVDLHQDIHVEESKHTEREISQGMLDVAEKAEQSEQGYDADLGVSF